MVAWSLTDIFLQGREEKCRILSVFGASPLLEIKSLDISTLLLTILS